jgi:hypothetical protein
MQSFPVPKEPKSVSLLALSQDRRGPQNESKGFWGLAAADNLSFPIVKSALHPHDPLTTPQTSAIDHLGFLIVKSPFRRRRSRAEAETLFTLRFAPKRETVESALLI